MRRSPGVSLALLLAVVLTGCGDPSPVAVDDGGGSTETTNGVTVVGVVRGSGGAAAADAAVRVRSESYLPDFGASVPCTSLSCIEATAGPDGAFRFVVPDGCADRLVASFVAASGEVASRGITIGHETDSVRLGTVGLHAPSTIEGTVEQDPAADVVYAAVRGTELWSRVAGDGTFRIEGVPEGAFSLHFSARTATGSTTTDYAVDVPASSTVTFDGALPVVDLGRDLAAWWDCDGADHDTLRGRGAGAYHALLEGVGREAGRFGRAISFDGPSDIARVISPLVPGSSGSFALWLNASSLKPTGIHRLVSSDTSAFEVTVRDRMPANELCAAELDVLVDSSTILESGRWYHLVCTWDVGSGAQRIYVDGELTAEGGPADDPVGPVQLTFGNSLLADHRHPFHGRLDEVRLYGVALTEERIRALAAGARE